MKHWQYRRGTLSRKRRNTRVSTARNKVAETCRRFARRFADARGAQRMCESRVRMLENFRERGARIPRSLRRFLK